MNIYEAITAIMNDGYVIGKEKTNKQQGFKYRGIDDVMNTFYPLLAKYKVFVVPEVLDESRHERTTERGGVLLYSILRIKYTFYAEDGSSVSAVVIGEGMDSGDKASNKAMAVGMKYALFQVFCIPTEDMPDPDAESHEVAPAPAPVPRKKPEDMMFRCAECGEVLKPYNDANGREVPIRKHAMGSEQKFGRVLCLDCIKKETAKEV